MAALEAAPVEKKEALLDAMGVALVFRGYDENGEPHFDRRAPGQPFALIGETICVDDAEQALDRVLTPEFSIKTQVVVEGLEACPPTIEMEGKIERLRSTDPNRAEFQVEATSPGWLVVGDAYFPGWQAAVNLEPVEIYPANSIFRAVQLPAGSSTTVFEYSPAGFRTGRWLSIAGLLLLGAILILWRDR